MTILTINSDTSLQDAFGKLRDMYRAHKYLRANIKKGKDRSIDQNSISHAWYQQIARELREDDALGWKCYCKLHIGVPLLRAEDAEFCEIYDSVIKCLPYEKKLKAMRVWPVTSIMTKPQLSKYLELMQEDFIQRGVLLDFPVE